MKGDRADLIITAEELELLSEMDEKAECEFASLAFDIAVINDKDELLLQLKGADGL
jgi:hypothetical protein